VAGEKPSAAPRIQNDRQERQDLAKNAKRVSYRSRRTVQIAKRTVRVLCSGPRRVMKTFLAFLAGLASLRSIWF